MRETDGAATLSDRIATELPYLRRHARALTGSQDSGDRYTAATLEAILEDGELFDRSASPRVALFKAFNTIWTSAGAPIAAEGADSGGDAERRAQWRMAGLTEDSREALLLHSIEGFAPEEIGEIMRVEAEEAMRLVRAAQTEMSEAVTGRVLIIEDEAIIAMDISAIVADMGHRVTGVARTHSGAVELMNRDPADLILADIQLADKSSGVEAVGEILRENGDRPVVFITAFPERLLTGERPEPAFLIAKPYSEEQVRSAVSQAMFFAGTETLTA